mgnify:CR=1 FL=1
MPKLHDGERMKTTMVERSARAAQFFWKTASVCLSFPSQWMFWLLCCCFWGFCWSQLSFKWLALHNHHHWHDDCHIGPFCSPVKMIMEATMETMDTANNQPSALSKSHAIRLENDWLELEMLPSRSRWHSFSSIDILLLSICPFCHPLSIPVILSTVFPIPFVTLLFHLFHGWLFVVLVSIILPSRLLVSASLIMVLCVLLCGLFLGPMVVHLSAPILWFIRVLYVNKVDQTATFSTIFH